MSDRILPKSIDRVLEDAYSKLRKALAAFDKANRELRYSEAFSTEAPTAHNAARLIAKAKMLEKARVAAVEAKSALDAEIARLAVVSDAPKHLTLVTSSGLQVEKKTRRSLRRAA